MVKKDIVNSLGARGALWEFMRSISTMACPNIISPEIIQALLKDRHHELFLKHCAKVLHFKLLIFYLMYFRVVQHYLQRCLKK